MNKKFFGLMPFFAVLTTLATVMICFTACNNADCTSTHVDDGLWMDESAQKGVYVDSPKVHSAIITNIGLYVYSEDYVQLSDFKRIVTVRGDIMTIKGSGLVYKKLNREPTGFSKYVELDINL